MAHSGRKARAKVNIPIFLAGVLLCLTLFSIYLSSGVVAKYTTNKADADSARVIRFGDITLAVNSGGYIAPGCPLTWNARVSFAGSESATYVFVDVSGVASADEDTVTPFEKGPSWTVDTATWKLVEDVEEHSGVWYLALAPNATLDGKPFFASDLSTTVSETLTAKDISSMGANPSFRASVVQSNGFDSPKEAWESLKNKH